MRRKQPSEKMLLARELRAKQMTIRKIAERMQITHTGVRYLLSAGDTFFKEKISGLKNYRNFFRKQNKC